jgi:O-acetyl-ADP-ribose deacetylase (regulator of RNase III)
LFPGSIHFWRNPKDGYPEWIANFPTKEDWRHPSKLEYIEKGLPELVRFIRACDIKSIAIPPLGCGLGGLPWPPVKAMIEKAFEPMPDVQVYLYQPAK